MTDKGFFRGHRRRGSFNLFSSYNHYTPGIGEIFILLFLLIAGSQLGDLVAKGAGFLLGRAFIETYGMLISYPTMFIPVMIYASARSRINEYNTPSRPLDNKLEGRRKGLILSIAAIFATFSAAYIVEPATFILPEMPQWLMEIMDNILANSPVWATLLSVSIFAPLFEEWLCRGIVLRGLLTRMHPVGAVTISAALFAIIHMNPWQAIPAFVLGLLFGYVYYRTGSLKLTMLMHFTNNTLAVILAKLPATKDADTFMDIFSPWAYWCIYASCIIIVICAVILFSNPKTPPPYQRSDA